MPCVPFIHEPEDLGSFPPEHCCFCGEPTRHWTDLPDREPGQQVACCVRCAVQNPWESVPSKTAWLAKERKSR